MISQPFLFGNQLSQLKDSRNNWAVPKKGKEALKADYCNTVIFDPNLGA